MELTDVAMFVMSQHDVVLLAPRDYIRLLDMSSMG